MPTALNSKKPTDFIFGDLYVKRKLLQSEAQIKQVSKNQ